MFDRNPKQFPFEYIPLRADLRGGSKSSNVEMSAEALNLEIKEAIRNNEDQKAAALITKMTKCYGVPGLIHYYNQQIVAIKYQLSIEEMADRPAMNALSYLFLAKHIYEMEPSNNKMTQELFPEEHISEQNYWDKKIAEMTALVTVTQHKIDEAKKVGISMYKPSASQKSPTIKSKII